MKKNQLKTRLFLSFLMTASPAGLYANSKAPLLEASPSSSIEDEDFIMLSVDKKSLTAEMLTVPTEGDSRVLRRFRVAIGKAEGDKEKEGDHKTPEGIYLTLDQIDGKTLPEKYGPWAIPLNFPNPIDEMEGKTGYGIWLHGVGNRDIKAAKVTEGCVAFENPEIRHLADWMEPDHSLVAISNDHTKVNAPEDIQMIRSKTVAWMNAWAARDVDSYAHFYHDLFQLGGRGKEAYRSYKKNVFQAYESMIVSLNELRVVTHPKYALSFFNQEFNGDNRFISNGRKILYWLKDDKGSWKIVREMFRKNPLKLKTFSDKDLKKFDRNYAGEDFHRAQGINQGLGHNDLDQSIKDLDDLDSIKEASLEPSLKSPKKSSSSSLRVPGTPRSEPKSL